jgi:hypothetical protein
VLIRIYRQFAAPEPSLDQLRTTGMGAGFGNAGRARHQAANRSSVGHVAHPKGYRVLTPALAAKDSGLPVDGQFEVA